jgi:cell division protein FtsB
MPRSWIQILAIVVFAVAIFVIWDFSQRVLTSVRLSQAEQALEIQVAREQATKNNLVDKRKQVQSDAYVEAYVRSKWHWVKDGDKIAIPQITLAPAPLIPFMPAPAPTPEPSTLQRVWDFLFGP